MANIITGTTGADFLAGTAGDDIIFGDAGNDSIFAGQTDGVPNDSDDIMIGGAGDDIIGGGLGNDILIGNAHIGSDDLTFGSADDSGSNTLFGGAGDDLIITGTYNNPGTDVSFAAAAGGALSAFVSGTGNNVAWAGAGNDIVYSGTGDDTIGGGAGDDQIFIAGGNNLVFGGQGLGNNTIETGDGDDVIYGGGAGGSNTITTSGGDNLIFGGKGDATITAGDGADTIFAGAGNNVVTGGAGADVFGFGVGNEGNTTITDFTFGEDIVGLQSFVEEFEDADAVVAAMEDSEDGAVLTLAEGQTVTFTGLTVNDFANETGPWVNLTGEPEGSTGGTEFELTQGTDVIEGTPQNDTITGVASSLASTRTLDASDQIDGGAGKDTLKIDMQGSFTGFTGDGFLKNVETVELTNSGTIARSFAAKGVEGVETYNLSGAVNLSDLASTDVAVNLEGRAAGTTTIGFTAKAVEGSDDSLDLGLTGIGTAEVKNDAGVVTTPEAAVTVTANGIETLNITATGTNIANLGSNDATALNIGGAGSLKMAEIGSGVKAIDASANTGGVNIDLNDATGITTLLGGSGNDRFVANPGDLAINAEINGGAGADTLVLKGAIGTVQYQMADVETIALDDATPLVYSAADTSGLENLSVAGAGNKATFANMGGIDLSVMLIKDAAGAVTSDHSGATTLKVTGGVKDAATTSTVNTVFTKSAGLDLVVDQHNTLTGDITANSATSFTADIAGSMTNTVSVNAATAGIFNQTNKDGSVTTTLNAAKMTDLQVTTAGDFTLTAASSLGAVESLTVNTSKDFDARDVDFDKVASVDLSGTGNDAKVQLKDLGSDTLDYGVTVTAAGLADGLIINDIKTGEGQTVDVNVAGVLGDVEIKDIKVETAGGTITVDANGTAGTVSLDNLAAKSVTVNAAGTLGTVSVDSITAETATFTGSALDENKVSVTASKSATVNGGIADDEITVNAVDGSKSTATITTGLGTDTVDLVGGGAGGADTQLFVTITDFTAGTDILEVGGAGWASDATIFLNTTAAEATAAVAALNAFDGISGVTTTNSKFVTFDADGVGAGPAQEGILFNGTVYTFNAVSAEDDSVLVGLQGVTLVDEADWLI